MEKLYLAVTADIYELPIAVCKSPTELARLLGMPVNTVYVTLSRGLSGVRQGFKLIQIEVGED